MKTDDFDFYLPEELIAQHPILERDTSRMMVMDKKTGVIEDKIFHDIIDNFTNIKNDIELISYAQYINELTYQVYKQSESEDIFNMYISTLIKLNSKQDPLILTNILELKYLDYLGVGLNLDCCVNCGDQRNIVTIDPD